MLSIIFGQILSWLRLYSQFYFSRLCICLYVSCPGSDMRFLMYFVAILFLWIGQITLGRAVNSDVLGSSSLLREFNLLGSSDWGIAS